MRLIWKSFRSLYFATLLMLLGSGLLSTYLALRLADTVDGLWVGALMAAGFESYLVDYRANTRTHYLPCGEALSLPNPEDDGPVAEAFDAAFAAAMKQSGPRLIEAYL